MKYTITINQKQAVDAGITNVSQAIILDLLTSCSTWATPEEHKGKIFYWVSRQSICRELPILKIQPDTAYRHLRGLAELGLIDYQKSGKKDLVRLTSKGRKYHSFRKSEGGEAENSPYVGKKSEFSEGETRPTEATQEQSGLSSPESDNTTQENTDLDTPKHEKPYVGKKSELLENTMSDSDPKKLGNNSEKARKKIRHISNTRSISNTNDQTADGEYSNIGSDIRFAMHDEWQPSSDHFPNLCRRAGLVDWQTYHTQETLIEFILFWSGQASELTQYNWELKYLKQLQRSKAHGNQNQSNGIGPGKPSRFIDENDTSFLDEDSELRQAIGLESNC